MLVRAPSAALPNAAKALEDRLDKSLPMALMAVVVSPGAPVLLMPSNRVPSALVWALESCATAVLASADTPAAGSALTRVPSCAMSAVVRPAALVPRLAT